MIIELKNESGITKTARTGFSFTTLLFGPLPALFRGDLKWAAIMIIASMLTFGLSWFVFPFIYNKIHLKSLLSSGYSAADQGEEQKLIDLGIISPV